MPYSVFMLNHIKTRPSQGSSVFTKSSDKNQIPRDIEIVFQWVITHHHRSAQHSPNAKQPRLHPSNHDGHLLVPPTLPRPRRLLHPNHAVGRFSRLARQPTRHLRIGMLSATGRQAHADVLLPVRRARVVSGSRLVDSRSVRRVARRDDPVGLYRDQWCRRLFDLRIPVGNGKGKRKWKGRAIIIFILK